MEAGGNGRGPVLWSGDRRTVKGAAWTGLIRPLIYADERLESVFGHLHLSTERCWLSTLLFSLSHLGATPDKTNRLPACHPSCLINSLSIAQLKRVKRCINCKPSSINDKVKQLASVCCGKINLRASLQLIETQPHQECLNLTTASYIFHLTAKIYRNRLEWKHTNNIS